MKCPLGMGGMEEEGRGGRAMYLPSWSVSDQLLIPHLSAKQRIMNSCMDMKK
jgi:hypothetical protein